jgi:hypothetical protein
MAQTNLEIATAGEQNADGSCDPAAGLAAIEAPLEHRLDPVAVRASAGEIEAFRRASFASEYGPAVPHTFPIRWVTLPEITNAIREMIAGDQWLPIHEAQNFEYRRPLEVDKAYRLTVDLRREANPPRLVIRGLVSTEANELCVSFETTLRIVATDRATPNSGNVQE